MRSVTAGSAAQAKGERRLESGRRNGMVGRVYVAVVRPLLVVGALFALGELLEAQQTGDEAAVRAVVARFHNGLTTGNTAAAMAVVGADAVFLEAGSVETRAQ
jgi:hypothetical protein